MTIRKIRLVSLAVRVVPAKLWGDPALSQRLYTAFTGETDEDLEPGPDDTFPRPVEVDIDADRLAIRWTPWAIRVSAESDAEPSTRIGLISAAVARINQVTAVDRFRTVHFYAVWVVPLEGLSFEEANSAYLARMVKDNPLVERADDSSVLADMRVGELMIHHQSGPMEPKQLANFAEFHHSTPDVFMFLLTSARQEQDEPIPYDDGLLDSFMHNALAPCLELAESFENLWGDL